MSSFAYPNVTPAGVVFPFDAACPVYSTVLVSGQVLDLGESGLVVHLTSFQNGRISSPLTNLFDLDQNSVKDHSAYLYANTDTGFLLPNQYLAFLSFATVPADYPLYVNVFAKWQTYTPSVVQQTQ
jgi:hypothetical protein